MSEQVMKQKAEENIFVKYKKWFIALIGLQLIPVLLFVALFGGAAVYLFMNNDSNFHPYKSYIESGYYAGHIDGRKDHISGQVPARSLWDNYWWETRELKEKVVLEKKEYLFQFPESERGKRLAEMKINNIKLPLQLELEKRFTKGIDFYADYVKQRVNRGNFLSDAAYNKALEDEAWKAGYAFGYRTGAAGHTQRDGLKDLKG